MIEPWGRESSRLGWLLEKFLWVVVVERRKRNVVAGCVAKWHLVLEEN
jgi:hypothetical protein